VVGVARETVKKKVGKSNIEELRQGLLKDFEAMGIYREQIENYLGHSLAATTVEEITELQGIIRSIKDGVTNRNDYFGAEAQRKGTPQEEKKEGDISLDQVLNGEVKHEGSKEGPTIQTTENFYINPTEFMGFTEQNRHRISTEPAPPTQHEWDERILEDFKGKLNKCITAVEVQEHAKQIKSTKAATRISDSLLSQIMNLANDRMRELLKKEAKR
jgi:hypothetical protein